MDALELVDREHDRLDAGLAILLCASPEAREPAAKGILRRLSAYLLAEEQCLYPALFATLGSATPLEPLTDHLRLKRLVAELLRMDTLEASFAACVSNLQGRLRSYGVRQQHSLFPLMHGIFSPGEMQLIGGEMQLFLGTNRRVTPGSALTAKALLEAVRALLVAASAQATVHERDETVPPRRTQARRT